MIIEGNNNDSKQMSWDEKEPSAIIKIAVWLEWN